MKWHGVETKKAAGRLKKLITEGTQRVERKNMPVITVPSYLNLVIATNEQWAVAVERYNRRYVVMETDNRYAGSQTPESRGYFDRLWSVPPECFAKYLYDRDISAWQPRTLPSTSATVDQMMLSANSVEAWLWNVLTTGALCSNDVLPSSQDTWDRQIEKRTVETAYTTYTQQQQRGRPVHTTILWKELRKAMPSIQTCRPRQGNDRQRTCQFPSLAQARREFAKYLRADVRQVFPRE